MIQPADNADQWVPQGVIVTKLAPPRLHRAPVPRDRLAADATASITVIVAPAGMGKTTLLRQWFDAQCDAGVQLAFTDAECCHFLKQTHGIDIADAQARRLNCAVEGWVAALQLAALSGRYPGPAANSDAMLAAGRADIFEFLASEVIDAQDAPMRAFLLDTSILERLSASLCDSVRESRDSDALLLRAERAGLFLLRLDGGHAWYRYHQLFAAFMRSHLGRETRGAHCWRSPWGGRRPTRARQRPMTQCLYRGCSIRGNGKHCSSPPPGCPTARLPSA